MPRSPVGGGGSGGWLQDAFEVIAGNFETLTLVEAVGVSATDP